MAARDLLEHGMTYWKPAYSGGMPAWVYPITDSFLVDCVPYLLLEPWVAYGFIMWLQRFIAGYFTFRLCRDILKLDIPASVFAGLSFSLYLWSVNDWTLFHGLGLPGTPLFLWMMERFINWSKGWGLISATILGSVVSLIAPTALFTVFFWGMLFAWFFVVRNMYSKYTIGLIFSFIIGSLLFAIPSLTALIVYSPFTARGQGIYIEPILSPIGQLIYQEVKQFLERDILNNIFYLVIFFMGISVYRGVKTLSWKLFFLFMFLAIGSRILHVGQILSGDMFPPSKGNLRDFLQFLVFLGPLLGAIGLHMLRKNLKLIISNKFNLQDKYKQGATLYLTALILLFPISSSAIVLVELSKRIASDNYAVNFNMPALNDLAEKTNNDIFRVATVGIRLPSVHSASNMKIYPAYAHAYGLESVDGYYNLHSARYRQFWLKVIGGVLELDPKLQGLTRQWVTKWLYLFAPSGNQFDKFKKVDFETYYSLELLSLVNTRYLISTWPLSHSNLHLIYEPINEKIEWNKWEKSRIRHKIKQIINGQLPSKAIYIYENTKVFPRAFVVNNVKQFDSTDELLESLSQMSLQELRSTALIERTDNINIPETIYTVQNSDVEILFYSPDRIDLAVQNSKPGLLVVTNNYDPYWELHIDGFHKNIIPAYHTFQGIWLESGNHKVVLEYRPPYRLN